MSDEKLVQYIKEQLDAGYNIETIRKTLEKYNYPDIDGSIGEALGKTDKTKSHLWIIVGIVLLTLLVLGGAIMFVVNSSEDTSFDEPEPLPPEENIPEETNIPVPPVETQPSDVKIGPPAKDASEEFPLQLPTKAIEIEAGSSAEFVVSVFVTEYLADLEPEVECDTGNNVITTYPFKGTLSYGDVHSIPFTIEGDDTVRLTECFIAFSTIDGRPMGSPFAIFTM